MLGAPLINLSHQLIFCVMCSSGLNIFQAFTSYLKSKKADDKTKDDLLKELAALDEHLQQHVSTFHQWSWYLHGCILNASLIFFPVP